MRSTSAGALLVILFLPAGVHKKDGPGEMAKELQGRWRSETAVANGKQFDKANQWTELRFEGDQATWENHTRTTARVTTSEVKHIYELAPAQLPKQIILTWTEGSNKGKKTWGIYRLDGDTLTLCVGQLDKEMPTAFESKEGSGQWLLVLKRVK